MKLFDLEARGTTVARVVRGGTATFLMCKQLTRVDFAIFFVLG